MIKLYQKKPVVIEAIQWDGTDICLGEIVHWMNHEVQNLENNKLGIETLEGVMEASVGDFIIKGVKGEFYPCKPDIFEQTYEEVPTPLQHNEELYEAAIEAMNNYGKENKSDD